MSRRADKILLHAVLIAGGVITLFPIFWMLSASVMATGEATSLPPHIVPHAPTLAQYRELFGRLKLAWRQIRPVSSNTTRMITMMPITPMPP